MEDPGLGLTSMRKPAEYLDRLATTNDLCCTAHVNEIAKGDPENQRKWIPKKKAPKKAKNKNKNKPKTDHDNMFRHTV
jgi:hypothetical protein